jgi:hypothetical protein
MKSKCKAARRALSTHKYGSIRRSRYGRRADVVRPDGSEPPDCEITPRLPTSIAGLIAAGPGEHAEMPACPFRLSRSEIHPEVTGIHTSGVGGHSPCRAYWSDVDGFGSLPDPVAIISMSCTGDYATAGGVQPTPPGYSPDCSGRHKPPAWADFTICGGRSIAKKGAERWRAPSLWSYHWVGFSAGTSVPVSPRAGLAEETSDPTHCPISQTRQRRMSR